MAQHVYLPNFSTLPQCVLLATAERRPELARAVANRFAVKVMGRAVLPPRLAKLALSSFLIATFWRPNSFLFRTEKRSWVDFSFPPFSALDREKRHMKKFLQKKVARLYRSI
jgi:hypothetical protein